MKKLFDELDQARLHQKKTELKEPLLEQTTKVKEDTHQDKGSYEPPKITPTAPNSPAESDDSDLPPNTAPPPVPGRG